MRLHGNAALSWQGRRRLARRVVIEGWTLIRAAEAARGQRALCPSVGGQVSVGGRVRVARSLLGAGAGRQPHTG
jgi:hypothetical protein